LFDFGPSIFYTLNTRIRCLHLFTRAESARRIPRTPPGPQVSNVTRETRGGAVALFLWLGCLRVVDQEKEKRNVSQPEPGPATQHSILHFSERPQSAAVKRRDAADHRSSDLEQRPRERTQPRIRKRTARTLGRPVAAPAFLHCRDRSAPSATVSALRPPVFPRFSLGRVG
jgi:hypothetical protein